MLITLISSLVKEIVLFNINTTQELIVTLSLFLSNLYLIMRGTVVFSIAIISSFINFTYASNVADGLSNIRPDTAIQNIDPTIGKVTNVLDAASDALRSTSSSGDPARNLASKKKKRAVNRGKRNLVPGVNEITENMDVPFSGIFNSGSVSQSRGTMQSSGSVRQTTGNTFSQGTQLDGTGIDQILGKREPPSTPPASKANSGDLLGTNQITSNIPIVGKLLSDPSSALSQTGKIPLASDILSGKTESVSSKPSTGTPQVPVKRSIVHNRRNLDAILSPVLGNKMIGGILQGKKKTTPDQTTNTPAAPVNRPIKQISVNRAGKRSFKRRDTHLPETVSNMSKNILTYDTNEIKKSVKETVNRT
ncbi:uncharacterized protein BX663DRAFT_515245 [Cokeromyces recurvatus]|uniref:uncharacterized protein n=1 Tax=Cokeromyces recurvatus TaxID=90255 RepID=UPI0022201EF4|nr:uncharacterized protein BX663DRAFT_515245 [Cokeromyces recurvatus]KAI7901202.1 hypothetical protein BX663DRAFT_515245 [Cokeromyces recurvatus]